MIKKESNCIKSINSKRLIIIVFFVVTVLIFTVIVFFVPKQFVDIGLVITDKDDNSIIEPVLNANDDIYTENIDFYSYIDIVVAEATRIVSGLKKISEDEAYEWLIKNGCVVKTAFDQTVIPKIYKAYITSEASGNDFGFVMTNLCGQVICSYSSSIEENFAVKLTQPYSSIKPLSVYAPAIESGRITYSTLFKDLPFKNISGENGEVIEWPQNGNGYFTGKDTSVVDAIRYSLNTVAVNCIIEDIPEAFDFLQNSLGVNLQYEAEKMELFGSEEVLSHIALGYLIEGVSPLDMAGYYSIFATGGKYVKPYSVTCIKTSDGREVYTAMPDKIEIISEETAYIMNRLLAAPLEKDGTAYRAAQENVSVIGKTGTGDNYTGCLFTCLTPEYAFSFWHNGEKIRKNVTPDIFNMLASQIQFDETKKFYECDGVKELQYCVESGNIATPKCPKVKPGFYSVASMPEKCFIHK